MTRSAYASSSAWCGSSAQVCGTHCVNSDITCVPSGQSVRSKTLGMHAVGERPRRRPALAGVMERLLEVVERVAQLDRAGVVLLARFVAGVGDEARQLGERDVDLHRARCELASARCRRRSRRAARASIWRRNVICGCVAATTMSVAQLGAVDERDADDPAVASRGSARPARSVRTSRRRTRPSGDRVATAPMPPIG